jgi:hypothetical protein
LLSFAMGAGADLRSLEVLLAAVAARIDALGLRPVSREIGLDPKSVTKLLAGTVPRPSTHQKLERWYIRAVPSGSGEPTPDDVMVALRVLTQSLAPHDRPVAERVILKALVQLCRRNGYATPGWLGAVVGELERTSVPATVRERTGGEKA